MLDLVDPQNGVTFQRFTARYEEPVKMIALEGAKPGEAAPRTLQGVGGSVFARLVRTERPPPPGDPSRSWSEVQVFVSELWRQQAGDPALFQLPAVESAGSSVATAPDQDGHGHTGPEEEAFVARARGILQRLPGRDLEIGREASLAEATLELGKLFPGVDTLANITELNASLKQRVEGADNVEEIVHWLLTFREKVRAKSKNDGTKQ